MIVEWNPQTVKRRPGEWTSCWTRASASVASTRRLRPISSVPHAEPTPTQPVSDDPQFSQRNFRSDRHTADMIGRSEDQSRRHDKIVWNHHDIPGRREFHEIGSVTVVGHDSASNARRQHTVRGIDVACEGDLGQAGKQAGHRNRSLIQADNSPLLSSAGIRPAMDSNLFRCSLECPVHELPDKFRALGLIGNAVAYLAVVPFPGRTSGDDPGARKLSTAGLAFRGRFGR